MTEIKEGNILNKVATPPNWTACYLVEDSKDSNEAEILKLPIILWVTVEFITDEESYQQIRHYIADPNGDVLDYLEIPYPFLCVIGPTCLDSDQAIRAALLDYQEYQEIEKEELENKMKSEKFIS